MKNEDGNKYKGKKHRKGDKKRERARDRIAASSESEREPSGKRRKTDRPDTNLKTLLKQVTEPRVNSDPTDTRQEHRVEKHEKDPNVDVCIQQVVRTRRRPKGSKDKKERKRRRKVDRVQASLSKSMSSKRT